MTPIIGGLQKTTNYRVVLPFYIYASLGLLLGTTLLLFSTKDLFVHYFNPHILALTHSMALAWGTMLIFGASHQLLPVLVEGKLNSDKLAYLTFGLMAIGIPFLIYGFYVFNVGAPLKIGATMINLGVLCYLLNVISTAFKNNQKNIHAWFAITATIWLLTTTFLGLLLVFNFQTPLLTNNSVYYLAVHAHLGIIGWFLLMVIGLGSRLIPMFLISKYTNNKILWLIFALLNIALISFLGFYLSGAPTYLYNIPIVMGVVAIILFGRHCYKAYKIRIRKNVDQQVTTSLIAVMLMLLPFIILIVTIGAIPKAYTNRMVMLYGFTIFFGWITAIILGMTFKTMPFIIWNKVYHSKAHKGRTPAPKEIFNNKVYKIMQFCYLGGFAIFIIGIILLNQTILQTGAISLFVSAILYVYNMIITTNHKSK